MNSKLFQLCARIASRIVCASSEMAFLIRQNILIVTDKSTSKSYFLCVDYLSALVSKQPLMREEAMIQKNGGNKYVRQYNTI